MQSVAAQDPAGVFINPSEIVYAREWIKEADVSSDNNNIEVDRNREIRMQTGVGTEWAPNSCYLYNYTIENATFSEIVEEAEDLTLRNRNDQRISIEHVLTYEIESISGAEGLVDQNAVTFKICNTHNSGSFSNGNNLKFQFDYKLTAPNSANDMRRNVTVTLKVMREGSDSVVTRRTRSFTIRGEDALVQEHDAVALTANADSFAGSDGSAVNAASVGSFKIGLLDVTRNGRNIATSTSKTPLKTNSGRSGDRVVRLNQVIMDGTTVDTGSHFVFEGDFSFPSKVTVDTSSTCDSSGASDLLKRDNNGEVTDRMRTKEWFIPTDQITGVSAGPFYLCLHAGSTPIPSTEPYMATSVYKKKAESSNPRVFAPGGGGSTGDGGSTFALGEISTLSPPTTDPDGEPADFASIGTYRVFAKETIPDISEIYDGTKYYKVGGTSSQLRISFHPIDVQKQAGEQIYLVTELSDGIMYGNVDASARNTDSLNILDNDGTAVRGIERRKLAGGSKGDNDVVFLLSGSGILDRDDRIDVSPAPIGLPLGVRSDLTVRAVNRDLPDLLHNEMVYENAYSFRQALTETVEPSNARTSDDFKKFHDGSLMVSVGSIKLGTAHPDPERRETPENREADPNNYDLHFLLSDADDGGTVKNASQLIGFGENEENGSYFTFHGDFSFASKVTVDKSPECDTENTPDLLARNPDDSTLSDKTKAWFLKKDDVTASDNHDVEGPALHLCIHVDGETSIPDTDPYTVTTRYAKISSDRAFAAESGEHFLGSINRGGETISIPNLTTSLIYNQRITIVNRGPKTEYRFSFISGDDPATPLAGSTGMLPENSSIVLKVRDLVETSGSDSDVSATLDINAGLNNIDVSSTQVNLDTGDTDTVVYQ